MKADYERMFELAQKCQEKASLFKPFTSLNLVEKEAFVEFLKPEIVNLEASLNQSVIKENQNEKDQLKKKVEVLESQVQTLLKDIEKANKDTKKYREQYQQLKESTSTTTKDFELLKQISELSQENNQLSKDNQVLIDKMATFETLKMQYSELKKEHDQQKSLIQH